MKQFQVIRDFEEALSEYTGAPFVTCVNSCTMALRLCLDWKKFNNPLSEEDKKYFDHYVEIPKRTYVSVPIQIKQTGFGIIFRDYNWEGLYQIAPLNIWDSARRFTSNMFSESFIWNTNAPHLSYMCVSFHYTKILGLNHGGAILHNDPRAVHFFREMRHDGRVEGMPIDNRHVRHLGHHCPMSVETASQGLVKLASLPRYNEDLPNSDYPDLSTFEIFK